ncbi:pentapeptide repeat-containing protein [Solitalea lacus]|uniref:pentapeptide repeat-containing protein n=1 Tax=Solitalea lacus TaxID=2911172 RepID=UPI001EDB0F5D|nr:pentapeptide repeat-containing protein [Solitalea lacus]UKJ08448.1 pentapeptide repeat-containing protein [Solitalea lacus]
MNKTYFEGETYKDINYIDHPLPKGEYENCRFSNCNFSTSNLSSIVFIDCEFDYCDLSMAKINETAFREVKFKKCKLMGLRFDTCNQFLLAFSFEGCMLNFSSFYKLKIKGTHFADCRVEEVDFVETDLTKALFKDCDLRMTVFENTLLEQADLRTAINFSINPEINNINKARFSTHNIIGLLDKYNIVVD